MKIIKSRWFGPVIVLLMLIFSAAVYGSLPAQVPSHYTFNGKVDGTMAREFIVVLMPGLALLIWVAMQIAPRIDPRGAAYERFMPTYHRFKAAIVIFLALLHVAILTRYDDPDVLVRFIFVGITTLMAFIGNELTRVPQTWFVGIRTPWTLSSETVWRRTHRVGGRAMFWVALAGIPVALLLPVQIAGIIVIGGLVAVSIGATIYSYFLWREETQQPSQ